MPNSAKSAPGFDRVRPRGSQPQAGATAADREGKRALFSDAPASGPSGVVTLHCRSCEGSSVMSWGAALRKALPSIPVALPGKGLRVHMKCPACGKRTWIEVHSA